MDPHQKKPLYLYVIAVTGVWTVILTLLWIFGTTDRLHTFAILGLGFALGMLAMYIAVHLYEWE